MIECYRAKAVLSRYPQFRFGRNTSGSVVIQDGFPHYSDPTQRIIISTETVGDQDELVVSFAGFGEIKRKKKLAQFRFKAGDRGTVKVIIPKDRGINWREALAVARDGLELIKISGELSTVEKFQAFYWEPDNPDKLGSWQVSGAEFKDKEKLEWQFKILTSPQFVPWD